MAPPTSNKTLKERIRHFTPSWFASSMGVGVLISLFHIFPYAAGPASRRVLDAFSAAFLVLNTVLFSIFSLMTILRYALFPEIWKLMIFHPIQSLFVGCFPMALATIINGAVTVAHQTYGIGGQDFVYFWWAVWWFDLAISIISNLGMLYIMVRHHSHSVQSLTACWLLPVVPTVVASTTGAIVASALVPYSIDHALLTAVVSFASVIMGLVMAYILLTLYVQRLIIHGFPTAGLTVSVLLPLGPFGQGGYALILLGKLFQSLAQHGPKGDTIYAIDHVGDIMRLVTFVGACLLWLSGLWFLVPALLVFATARKIPFGMPWWGMIFPGGVYSILTIQLSHEIDSQVLRVFGTMLTISIFILFAFVACWTVQDAITGAMFHAPCLDSQPMVVSTTPRDDTIELATTVGPQEQNTGRMGHRGH